MDDIGDELSDSLSRSGKGGMSAALLLDDGTVSLPGVSFGSDPNTGLYRAGADDLRIGTGGAINAKFDGGVTLYHAGTARFTSTTAGFTANGTVFGHVSTGSGLVENETRNSVGGLQLSVLATTADVQIAQTDSSGIVEDVWLNLARNGAVSLYFNNAKALGTTVEGISVLDTSGSAPVLTLRTDANSIVTRLQSDGTDSVVRNAVNSGVISVQGTNSGGSVVAMLRGDPDDAATLYYQGTDALNTSATGISVRSAGSDARVLLQDSGAASLAQMFTSSDDLFIETLATDKDMYLRVNDGGVQDNAIVMISGGATTLYNDASARVATTSTGAQVSGTIFDFVNTASTLTENQTRNSVGGLQLSVLATTADVQISQTDSSGIVEDVWLNLERNGAVTLYHNNVVSLATYTDNLTGIEVGSSGSNQLRIRPWDATDSDIDGLLSGSTFGGLVEGTASGHMVIGVRGNDSNDSFAVVGTDDGDAVYDTLMIHAAAGGAATLYYDGTSKLATTSLGVSIDNGTGSALLLVTGADAEGDDGGQINLEGAGTDTYVALDNYNGIIRLLVNDASQIGLQSEPSGAVTLYYSGTAEFVTQNSDASYNTSGAQVKDHSGTYQDVGFNVMPVVEQDTSTTLDEADVGKMLHRDATGDATYTLPSGTSGAVPPVGALVMLTNENGTGTVTVSAAGTLRWFNGDGTPSTGNRTLAEGGVCSMYHYANTEWWVWGTGLS
jgi:hypothetical protein